MPKSTAKVFIHKVAYGKKVQSNDVPERNGTNFVRLEMGNNSHLPNWLHHSYASATEHVQLRKEVPEPTKYDRPEEKPDSSWLPSEPVFPSFVKNCVKRVSRLTLVKLPPSRSYWLAAIRLKSSFTWDYAPITNITSRTSVK